jgi:hypothetical protein
VVDRVVQLSDGEYEVHYIGVNWLFDLEWARPVSPFGASALWGPVAA